MLELKWEFKGGKCVGVRWVRCESASEKSETVVQDSDSEDSLKAS